MLTLALPLGVQEPLLVFCSNLSLTHAGPKIPSYARETMTSRQHTREDLFASKVTSLPAVDIQRSKSDLGGSVVSEAPLEQEKKQDEEFLVIVSLYFCTNSDFQ